MLRARDDVDPGEARASDPAGEHEVPVQPVPARHERGEAHPDLQRDAGLLRQHPHGPEDPRGGQHLIEDGAHLRVGAREQLVHAAQRSARVRLIAVREAPPAVRARPQLLHRRPYCVWRTAPGGDQPAGPARAAGLPSAVRLCCPCLVRGSPPRRRAPSIARECPCPTESSSSARVRRPRHGDRAQAGGHRRLRRAGPGRGPRRDLARQHLPGPELRRAVAALLLLVPALPLEPALPAAGRRSSPTCTRSWPSSGSARTCGSARRSRPPASTATAPERGELAGRSG